MFDARKTSMKNLGTLFDKDHREITNTWMAIAAVVISLLTLAFTQYQQWTANREIFTINAEGENNGPIEIVEMQGRKFFETYA